MKPFNYVVLFFVLSFMTSCGDGSTYSERQSISQEVWTYDAPMVFSFDIASSDILNDLILSLEYSTDFGYQNLYVKIITEYPSQGSTEDIVSLNLTDGRGSFNGDCSGSKCTTDILLQENFRFKETGNHTIKIYQNSRESELKSISGGTLKLFEKQKN